MLRFRFDSIDNDIGLLILIMPVTLYSKVIVYSHYFTPAIWLSPIGNYSPAGHRPLY